MATPTTISAFKKALKTNVAGLAELTGRQISVSYGDPGQTGRRINVYMGGTDLNDQEPASMRPGKYRLREEYTIHLIIEVIGFRPSAEDNEAEAVRLLGEIEDLIAGDVTLGNVPGVLFALVQGFDMETTEIGEEPRTVIDLRIGVKADLARV